MLVAAFFIRNRDPLVFREGVSIIRQPYKWWRREMRRHLKSGGLVKREVSTFFDGLGFHEVVTISNRTEGGKQ